MLCVMSPDEFDVTLSPGTPVGEVFPAAIQTRVCQNCGCLDTDAWVSDEKTPRCPDCGVAKAGGVSACRQCGAGPEECCVLGYAGCGGCRPERKLRGKVKQGPATRFLASAALAYMTLLAVSDMGQSNATIDKGDIAGARGHSHRDKFPGDVAAQVHQ